MKTAPLVSIVTNAYNQGSFLRKCIESVLGQSYPNIEYIVIDPGSTDDTPAILAEYKDRITVISEQDSGPADGLNKGFRAAEGEIFAYLNADDLYLKDAVANAVANLNSRPTAAALCAGGYIANGSGIITKKIESSPLTLGRFKRGNFLILQQSTFYRSKEFWEAGGFNIDNGTSWDLELLIDLLLKGYEVKQVDGAWSVFTVHPNSITGSQRLRSKSIENHARIFEGVFGRPPSQFELRTRNLWGKSLKIERPIKYINGSIIVPRKNLTIEALV